MEKEKIANEILFSMEMAEAQLSDDIDFLHCIHEEYLSTKEPKESLQYLYWQLSAMITILIKSMKYNQKEMQSNADKYFKQLKSMKEGVTNVSNN